MLSLSMSFFHRQSRIRGFTIVELLIVIVVIGVLAGVAIVAYNGIQRRARAAATESERTAVVKAIRQFAVMNSNNLPESQSDLSSVGLGSMSNKITDVGYTSWTAGNTPKDKYRVRNGNWTTASNVCTTGISGASRCAYRYHNFEYYWWDHIDGVWMGYREINHDHPDIATRTWGPRQLEYYAESNGWMGGPCDQTTVEQCDSM